MNTFLTASGAALLVFCFIWAAVWLEVTRDPKEELRDFYTRHPDVQRWVKVTNRLWLPIFIIGLIFIGLGIILGGRS